MDYIRLKPHHITFIIAAQTITQRQREKNRAIFIHAYGPFYDRLLAFSVSVRDMTRIEIVKTSDHICNTLRCPYQPLCSSGRSREVGQQIIAKLEDRCPDSARKEIERGAKGHSKDLNLQDRLPYGLKTTFRDLKARMEAP